MRVVIAEDEAIIRLDLKETLEKEGYEVVGETNRGDEAVTLVARPPARPRHPRHQDAGDGRDRGGTGDRVGRRAAVLILTAFSQRDLVQQATDAGAMNYLVKPFQTSALIPAIEVALARFAEVKSLEQQSDDLREQLDTRRLVHRAQGLLQDRYAMAEAEAFTFIQRTAMRLRSKMKVVAEKILAGDLTPEG